MKTKLEFRCAYSATAGPVVSVTPLEHVRGAKMMGFPVSRIEIFHVEGSRLVSDIDIPVHATKAFEQRLTVTVETKKPIKRVDSYAFSKGPAEIFYTGTGRNIALCIHRDIAQLSEVSLRKDTIRAKSCEPGFSLLFSAYIGLLGETLTVPLATFEDNITSIIKAHTPEMEACKTKAQLEACLEKFHSELKLRDELRLRWEMEPCETIYRRYQEETSVAFR